MSKDERCDGQDWINTKPKITEYKFTKAVGREPRYDDMSRVNCPDAGKMGHHFCGWCETHNLPRWHCTH